MRQYIKLLRLPDHISMAGSVFAAGLVLHIRDQRVFLRLGACIAISISAHIINELVDSKDTDIWSWNPIHVKQNISLTIWLKIIVATFLAIGLWLSHTLHLFWWGVMIATLAILYSVPPVRFKARPIIDLVSQILAAFILPFIGLFIVSSFLPSWLASVVIALSLVLIAGLLLYQVSDIEADKKAHIYPSHVVLGPRNTVMVALLLSLLGVGYILLTNLYAVVWWLRIFVVLGIGTAIWCIALLHVSPESGRSILKQYVTHMRLVTTGLTLLFFLLWQFSHL